MTETPFQIWWNNFTGWMNDQKYQWQPWRYFEWYWVDTQRFDVVPKNNPELLYSFPTWNISAILNLNKITGVNYKNIITVDGKVYLLEENVDFEIPKEVLDKEILDLVP